MRLHTDTHSLSVHVWKVARYTCSSPLYFGEYDNYIDMGPLCKNPCDIGLTKIRMYYQDKQLESSISAVVSLGDGRLSQPFDSICPLKINSVADVEAIQSWFHNVVALYHCAAVSVINYVCVYVEHMILVSLLVELSG